MASKRNYKQERKTAIARGETGIGSESGDSRRHRDRRKYIKENGALSSDEHVHHSGKGATGSTTKKSASKNMADGGKRGDKKGKARGGAKSKPPKK